MEQASVLERGHQSPVHSEAAEMQFLFFVLVEKPALFLMVLSCQVQTQKMQTLDGRQLPVKTQQLNAS